MRCRKPFLVQIEQLHAVTRERSAVTRKRTRPQWQPPVIVLGMFAPDKAILVRGVYHRPAAASGPITGDLPWRAALALVVDASTWGTIAMIRGLRLTAAALAMMHATPAMAECAMTECADEVCGSLQRILAARSGNFAKLKGKPSVDTRGDAVWLGTQAI